MLYIDEASEPANSNTAAESSPPPDTAQETESTDSKQQKNTTPPTRQSPTQKHTTSPLSKPLNDRRGKLPVWKVKMEEEKARALKVCLLYICAPLFSLYSVVIVQ